MLGSLKKSIRKTFVRATEIITGSGPTPAKQFRNAIVDGDEEKAIVIYTSCPKEGEKCLFEELHPSQPFPSKRPNVSETPLYLASKYALEKLIVLLLERGGDPGYLNGKQETCIHVVCSLEDKPEIRATIIEHFMSWNNGFELGLIQEKVSVNKVDIDGNTAIHNAAAAGLITCVEKLVNYGAIISIVNKGNNTCCEIADSSGHKNLAMMLELALVFQAEEFDLSQFDDFAVGDGRDLHGKLYIDTQSLTTAGINSFIEEAVGKISVYLGWMEAKKFRPRAEVLLNAYSWDVKRLRTALLEDSSKVLTTAKMDPSTQVSRPNVPTVGKETQKETENAKTSDEKPLESSNTGAIEEEIKITIEEIQGNSTVATENIPKVESAPVTQEPMLCTICCEEIMPEKDVSFFIKHNTVDQGRHCLSCLSGHSFCLDCWSAHLSVQVSENGLGWMPCPGYKCGEILDLSWAPVLLKSQELVNRLRNQRVRHVVDCAGFKHCPIEGCGLIVHIPKENTNIDTRSSALLRTPGSEISSSETAQSLLPHVAMCDNNHLFCVSCFQTAHSPCSCVQYPQWFQLVREETQSVADVSGTNPSASGDDIANALWVAANTKRCPRCGTAIEKDEGCNHMSCRKCRKEFCWICMQDWSLHSENTGGYFQCNRFQDTATNGGAGNDNGGDIWAEERGNAHAEAIRMRQRNRKMARFIHHYTRYQVHGQSFLMESRMSKETYKRIEDGLKASMRGELKWLPGAVVPNPMVVSLSAANSPRNNTSRPQHSPNNNNNSQSTVGLKESAMSPLEAALMAGMQQLQEDQPVEENNQEIVNQLQQTDNSSIHEHVDNVLASHYVKPSPYLQFLSDGFHELLKCRQLLQWTYPYAYFEFEDSDQTDYNSARRRGWQFRAQDHRTSFELMQADLESTVETLSDVCARRRLRASRAQITQATRAAKQKRIEFESLLLAYALAKQQYAQQQQSTPNSSAALSPGGAGSLRNTPQSSRLRNRHTRTSAQRRLRAVEDPIDEIASLIRDLEMATGSYLGDNLHAAPTSSASRGTGGATRRTPHTTVTPSTAATTSSVSRHRRSSSRRHRNNNENSISSSSSSSSDSVSSVDERHRVRHPHRSGGISLTGEELGGGREVEDEEEDLFALNRALERSRFEHELTTGRRSTPTTTRRSHRRGLFEEAADDDEREEDETLFDDAATAFAFLQLSEANEHSSSATTTTTGNGEGENPRNETAESNPESDNVGTLASPPARPRRTSGRSSRPATTPATPEMHLLSHLSESRLARLAQRAEEEEQLNRAILLSLRAESSFNRAPSEAHIATLEAMGFGRDQVIQALRVSGDDVEAAAMQLLG